MALVVATAAAPTYAEGTDAALSVDLSGNLRTGGGGGGGGNTTTAAGYLDSTNTLVPIDSYAQTLTYNGDGTVNTIAATNGVNTWTQTFGYTSGQVTSISRWVKS